MPNPRVWNRRLHRWGSAAVALPFLVVLVTGVLLQLKKQLAWVQPPERRGAPAAVDAPQVSFDAMLAAVRAVPEAGVRSWADVDRVDVRPSRGMAKVTSRTRWEVQLDLGTGRVLQTAYRRSDLIESLHDGSWFHPAAKLGVFLPTALVVVGLWGTGAYLFVLPYRARRAARLTRAAAAPGAAARATAQ